MEWRRSGSLFFLFIISPLLILFGCSKPVLKMPEPLSPIVKKCKHITLRGGAAGMRDTGIYLNRGDTYSLMATGSFDYCPGRICEAGHDVRPEDGWPLMARIGKNQFFHPLHRGVNADTTTADQSGNLYVGYRQGELDRYGKPLNPEYYHNDTGAFHVDIIVWETDDYAQIADFFERMKAKNPGNKPVLDALSHAKTLKSVRPTVSGLKESAVPPKLEEKAPEVKEVAVPPKVKRGSVEIEHLIQNGAKLIDQGKYDQVLKLVEDLPAESRKQIQIQTLVCFANLKGYLSEADQVKKLNWWALRKKLVDWGDREATPLLVAFLKAEDAYLRKYAAELLCHIGDERALEALREVGEHDESHRVRRYAKRAYEQISGEKF